MRWERLFDDLEGQFEEGGYEELRAEVADRTRREIALIRVADRLRDAVGRELTLQVVGVGRLGGRVASTGPDWLLLTEPAGAESIVPLGAITQIIGLGRRVGASGTVERRLDLGYVLRGIARDRVEVAVTLTDGTVLSGRVDRVGADHVDVALSPSDGMTTLPTTAVARVRRSP